MKNKLVPISVPKIMNIGLDFLELFENVTRVRVFLDTVYIYLAFLMYATVIGDMSLIMFIIAWLPKIV